MITVPIQYIQDSFFSEGKEYKYSSSYNSRIICTEVENPLIELQFSVYEKVQVTEEHAKKIKFVMNECIPNMRRDLKAMENVLKSLEEQGI